MQRRDLARLRAELTAHVLFSLRTAIEAVGHNTLRAGLTSLGILFGVASVIAMLAIGKGAEREILEQMVLLGSNNVMVTPHSAGTSDRSRIAAQVQIGQETARLLKGMRPMSVVNPDVFSRIPPRPAAINV